MAIRRTFGLLLATVVASTGFAMNSADARATTAPTQQAAASADVSVTATIRPRLIAPSSTVAKVVADTSDPVTAKLRSYVLRRADKLIGSTPVSYSITGDRLLAVSEQLADRSYTLAAAWLITKDTKYTNQLWQDISAAANFPDWNPQHFIDTGEMANAVGIAYDWGYGAWTASQKSTMQDALIRKAFEPGLEFYNLSASATTTQYTYSGTWQKTPNNWNLINNAGLGMAAMAILGDSSSSIPQTILNDSVSSIKSGLTEYSTDGGFPEGPSYWEWAKLSP